MRSTTQHPEAPHLDLDAPPRRPGWLDLREEVRSEHSTAPPGLLARLRSLPEGLAETEELARRLGLDPEGCMAVAVTGAGALPALPVPHVIAPEPGCTGVLVPCAGDAAEGEIEVAALLRRAGVGPVGVGITRQGLLGAQQSLQDAEGAQRLAVALAAPVVLFRESWLASLALEHSAQLGALVGPAVHALSSDLEVRATMEAFLAADGNLTTAGKALYVHANTVGYRLRQFARRTGIDPRTVGGKALIQIALTYSRTGNAP
jgi:hypothetical protein